MSDWQQMLAEQIATEKREAEARLGRSLTPDEVAYAEDRARLKAPDDPNSLNGRWAHGVPLEVLGVDVERRGYRIIEPPAPRGR